MVFNKTCDEQFGVGINKIWVGCTDLIPCHIYAIIPRTIRKIDIDVPVIAEIRVEGKPEQANFLSGTEGNPAADIQKRLDLPTSHTGVIWKDPN